MYITSKLTVLSLSSGRLCVQQETAETEYGEAIFDEIRQALEVTIVTKKIIAVAVANHGSIDEDDGSVTVHVEGLHDSFVFYFKGTAPNKGTGLDRAKVFAQYVLDALNEEFQM